MPFTGSHPAAVLPLLRTGLPPSALVIGSMAPDLPYFVPLPVGSGLTHSPAGVVTVDLALALAAYAVWHALLVPPLLAWAPRSLRARLAESGAVRSPAATGGPGWVARPRRLAAVAAGCVVGALTHVAWDAFTHAGRWGVRHVAWLEAAQGPLPGYRWAQYAGGVLGLVLLAAWLYRWWRRPGPPAAAAGAIAGGPPAVQRTPAGRPTPLQALVAVAAAGLAGAALRPFPAALDGDLGLRQAAFLMVTGAGGGALLVLAVLSCWWHASAGRRRRA